MQPLIELKNIYKTYETTEQTHTVLNGINFKLFAGECLSIMGVSGSGKSTLMNILGLLDRPTSGEYFLQNTLVADLEEDQRAVLRNQTIGFVFQLFFLLPRLTLLQNVGLPLFYRGCTDDEIKRRAQQMLEKVGLEKFSHYRPSQLSGGQQQRAAIARALVGNPKVILADEPTGALDSQNGQMIMDLFHDLNRNEQVTVVIVTHDASIAAQCQRTVHIQDGKIVDGVS